MTKAMRTHRSSQVCLPNAHATLSLLPKGKDDGDDEVHGDDEDIHPVPQHEPPVDTLVLRQMFAAMTKLSRDVQQLQQAFTALDLWVHDMLIGILDHYTGMMDDMQFRADQTYNMVHGMQAEMASGLL
ncbi:Hypothetical predicted protein [Olea europaea subsp. europaea]|uniref:Uncharacterized protein n=1 Tax=Olea europaea subsp. europaea TaxID=158383 RepID=A0A8S0T760_OLEEU|nr:Hypothetical predicted protein [Olea europaea subsp. europaea]